MHPKDRLSQTGHDTIFLQKYHRKPIEDIRKVFILPMEFIRISFTMIMKL
jgi:hypothetical protein